MLGRFFGRPQKNHEDSLMLSSLALRCVNRVRTARFANLANSLRSLINLEIFEELNVPKKLRIGKGKRDRVIRQKFGFRSVVRNQS